MNDQKCVAYMRYSTDNQTENSIEYQRAAIQNYCQKNGLTLVKEFVDEAYSGSNDKRPGFQRMIAEANNKPEWRTILIYDLSRMFRNRDDAVRYKAELRDKGFRIVSVTENFSSAAEGQLFESVVDLLNDFYSKDSSKKTHAGMTVKARSAVHCGGIPPLGYDIGPDGKLAINEAEADTVRMIFDLYAMGYSYKKMAGFLNEKGIRTKAGKEFTKNSFYNILTQEKYIGIYRWNKRRAKNSKGQHDNHAYKPLEQQIVVENGCPAIVSQKQFQLVQKRLAEQTQGRAASKSRHHYMLGGMKLIKCAKCGKYMTGKITTSHGKKYITYACPNHKGKHCPVKDIQAESLDEYVAALIAKRLLTKDKLPEINNAIANGNDTEQAKKLRNQLQSVEKRIANVAKGLEMGYSETLLETLRGLEQKKKTLTDQLLATNSALDHKQL